MNPLFKPFFIAGILFISLLSLAQPKTAASWSAKFTSAINWQRVHSLGYIIVSTNDGLYGVNPTDGKIIWENKKYAALDPSLLEEVEGTEFLTISYKTDQSSTIPLQALIEVTGGKVLFDSQKEGIGVLSRHVLPLSGRLLIIGVKQGQDLKNIVATLFMYDIQSGKQLWINEDLFKPEATTTKGFLGKLQALGQQFGNLQKLTSEPLEVDAQNVVITHPSYVMKLKSETGELVWKNKITTSKNAAILFSPFKKNVTFVATEVESESGSGFTTSKQQGPTKFYTNLYYAFDSNTGGPLWKQPAKENDHMNQVIMHEKGIIICPRSSQKPTINLVNYETGETMWGNKGKGIKAQGSVVNYLPTENGILITTAFDNAWNDKAEEYYLNVLDPVAGKLRYEKSVKLKGDLVRSELVPKGLLFITTREVNILDVNSGTLVWENSIEAGGPSSGDKVRPFPTGDKGNKLYVYSPKDESVYEVDKQAGSNKKITSSKIQFEGKERPRSIDVADDGLVLSSEQNIVKVSYDGLLKFGKYYPAPRQPALVRALLLAQAVRAAYIGAAASAYSAAFAQASQKTTDPSGKAMGQQLSKSFGQLGQAGFAYSSMAMKQFSARFKASQNTPGFVMMMTAQEKKGNQLIQVSKSSGVIVSAIDIKNDREPEYDVDQIYNYVYYRPIPAEIVCYKL
ncbi:MAG: PQQ-binding-like beta-propeller repeat protein [Bacteroidetes bacterium]|nr:PQQ-binding-like beta-propeller repeat protein [Bacteroidota bacterium]